MRVAIVNDLNLAVEALRRVVDSEPGLKTAWVAADGCEAVKKCKADPPDLILMDLVMPEMDGVEATRRIMLESPLPILIVTATIEGHGDMVYEALGHGALDAAVTPTLGLKGKVEGGRELLDKIAGVAVVAGLPAKPPRPHPALVLPKLKIPGEEIHCPLVAIGASTGGPKALADLFALLPADFPAAVAVVQHLDAHFAEGLRDWLAARSNMPVHLAAQTQSLQPGAIYLAARDAHWIAEPKGHLLYSPDPMDSIHRPSVDLFFESLADAWQNVGAGILLTGMGRDGAEGLLKLKQKGWTTYAQDAASSVVYGMPKAAVALNAADNVLDIPGIAAALNAWQS